jgi:hypothetical protein
VPHAGAWGASLHQGHCIRESKQHLSGWNTIHLSAAPETICIDHAVGHDGTRHCVGKHVLNPYNHYGCRYFAPIMGKGRCGNKGLQGHPTRDLDGDAACECQQQPHSVAGHPKRPLRRRLRHQGQGAAAAAATAAAATATADAAAAATTATTTTAPADAALLLDPLAIILDDRSGVPPTLRLSGPATIHLAATRAEEYEDAGAVCTSGDGEGRPLSHNVQVQGDVVTDRPGTYRIVYSCEDYQTGGTAPVATRTVVVNGPPTPPPTPRDASRFVVQLELELGGLHLRHTAALYSWEKGGATATATATATAAAAAAATATAAAAATLVGVVRAAVGLVVDAPPSRVKLRPLGATSASFKVLVDCGTFAGTAARIKEHVSAPGFGAELRSALIKRGAVLATDKAFGGAAVSVLGTKVHKIACRSATKC